MTRRVAGIAAPVLLAITTATLTTYPLVRHAGSAIITGEPDCPPAKCCDNQHDVWAVNQVAERLLRAPLELFEGNMFHPFRHTLAFGESMPAAALIAAPVRRLTGNPILAYNVAYLASGALLVLGVFLLVREITGDPVAAGVAGWMAGLMPEHWAFRGFLQAIAVQWVPFVLWAWLRYLDGPSPLRALALAALVALHTQASAYLAFAVPVLLVLWATALAWTGHWPSTRWVGSVAVVSVGLAAGMGLYLAVRRELQTPIMGYFPAPSAGYWQPYAHPLAYVASWFSGTRHPSGMSPLPVLLLAVAALRSTAARNPFTPHVCAFACFIAGAIALTLGPENPGLALLLQPVHALWRLPGFDSIRAPGRLCILASLGGAMLLGVSLAMLRSGMAGRGVRATVTACVATMVLIDSRTLAERMPLTRLDVLRHQAPVYAWLATTPPETAVLELPCGNWGDDTTYMLASLQHGRAIMNGYANSRPQFGRVIAAFPDPTSLRALADAGIAHVIVHDRRFVTGPILARLARYPTPLPHRRIGNAWVIDVPPAPASAALPLEHPLDRRSWHLDASTPGAERAADGDLASHWTVDATAESWLRIDLGTPATVAALRLRLERHVLEYPHAYAVRTSLDGHDWEDAGGEDPTLPPFASYRVDHLDVMIPIRLPPRLARWLELRVPPNAAPGAPPWGIHELEVFGASREMATPSHQDVGATGGDIVECQAAALVTRGAARACRGDA